MRTSREQLRSLSAHLESVREEERKNIAREIHDELGQTLTALKIDLSWLTKRLPKEPALLLEKTKSMYELLDMAIQTVNRISAASAGLALAPGMSCAVSATILALGNNEQKAKYLPALAKGEWLGALAAAEPSGGAHYPVTMQSTARLKDESYLLNGTKCFISNGGEAEIYLVLARTDPEKGPMGIGGLIVEKGTPGFSFGKKEEKLGLRCDSPASLFLKTVGVIVFSASSLAWPTSSFTIGWTR